MLYDEAREARIFMTDEEAAENYCAEEMHNGVAWDDLRDALKDAFLAGVEHGRKLIEQRERMAFEAGQEDDGISPCGVCAGATWRKYKSFDDWKKEPQPFNPAQDEAEHLERIRKEVEK